MKTHSATKKYKREKEKVNRANGDQKCQLAGKRTKPLNPHSVLLFFLVSLFKSNVHLKLRRRLGRTWEREGKEEKGMGSIRGGEQ